MLMTLLSIFIPLIGGLFLCTRGKKAIIACCAACLAVNAAIAVLPDFSANLWSIADGLNVTLRADAISKLFAVLMSLAWLTACVYSFEYMDGERDIPRFYRFFLLTLSALMLICYAGGFAAFFIGFEAMTLLSMPLVIHERTREARAAAMKYIGFSMFGAALALAAVFALGIWGAGLEFTPGGALGEAAAGHREALLVLWLLAVAGFGAKAGMFPLHSWLPTAHPVAPSPASAVLSGVITKCGVLGIIRVTFFVFGADFLAGTWAQYAALALSLVTVFMGSMMALGENLLKKRLAYSTVSQVSYVIFGLMLLNRAGFEGAISQSVFHLLAKNALFLWAGAVIKQTGFTRADELRGLSRRMPVSMWAFLIASLSLIGIPPTGGFAAKWLLASGALELGGVGYAGVVTLIVSALLTAGYLIPIASIAFFPGRDAYALPAEKCEPGAGMVAPMLLLALFTVIVGIYPNIIIDFISGVAAALF